MSDVDTSAVPAGTTDPAPAAPPPAVAPEPAAPAVAPETPAPDAPPPWEGKTAEELYKLNGELMQQNKGYRDRIKPFEETFGQLHPQDAEFFHDFLRAVQSKDEAKLAQVAPVMREVLDQLSPAQQQAVADAIDDATDFTDPKNIESFVDKRLADRDAVQARERAVESAKADMAKKAGELAKQHSLPSLGDASHSDGALLYILANNKFAGEPDPMVRLEKAAQLISDERRAAVQELLKAKAADAAPSPVPADAVEPAGAQRPASLADAKVAASERIDKLMRGEVGS